MKTTKLQKLLSSLLCIVLIAAMALTCTGCNDTPSDQSALSDTATTTAKAETVSFTFTVTDTEGEETSFEITTTEKTVGAALLKEGLISGEEGQYGLYVKTVNGITLDFDKDGKYWAFYVNGEYAMTGVDATDIVAGETYAFKAE